MRRLSLNRSEPAKKSGQNIPKNRCRTTIAERMGETRAELPFIGDQVVCLSHDQAGGEAGNGVAVAVLASAGSSLPVIGALLGHTQAGTTSRYAHLFDDPLRAATERVGAIVMGTGTKPVADVIALNRR